MKYGHPYVCTFVCLKTLEFLEVENMRGTQESTLCCVEVLPQFRNSWAIAVRKWLGLENVM